MNTNTTIERSLVLGLSRILIDYGWTWQEGEQHSLDKQVEFIKDLLSSGSASYLQLTLKSLIQHRSEKHDWGKFSPEYVHGIETLLSKFIIINELNEESPTFKFTWSLPKKVSGNLFKEDTECKQALRRLRSFGKTNLNYLYVERYGLAKLKRDLKAAGYPNAEIYINNEDHVPDMFREEFSKVGAQSLKLWIFWPIMPLVVLSLNA